MVLEKEIRRLEAKTRTKKAMSLFTKSRLGWKFRKGGFLETDSLTKTVGGKRITIQMWKFPLLKLTSYSVDVNGESVIRKESMLDDAFVKEVNGLLRNPSRIIRLAKLRKLI